MFMILSIHFFVLAIEEQEAGNLYPETLFSGEMPDEAMEKSFEADNAGYANDYEDGLDEDDLDV
jgi:hypothetical protein